MRRGKSLTPAGTLVLILAIGIAVWLQSQRDTPSTSPSAPPPAASTQTPAPTPASSPDAYDLSRDERLGGHTLARHVGRSDDQLRERLRSEPGISAASTYNNRAIAERVIGVTLAREKRRVDAWLARQGSRPNLALDYHGTAGDTIGRSIRRGGASRSCEDAVVVLRWNRDGGFIVLTSYPEAR
jgi:hypothetical protein